MSPINQRFLFNLELGLHVRVLTLSDFKWRIVLYGPASIVMCYVGLENYKI